jgi:hypothetical protein
MHDRPAEPALASCRQAPYVVDMRIGSLVLVVAVLHTLVGTLIYRGELAAIAAAGVFGVVGDRGDRAAAFWFLIAGLMAGVLGLTLQGFERRGAPVPAVLAPALIALTAAMAIPMPATGGWLFLPIAWLAWRRSRLHA